MATMSAEASNQVASLDKAIVETLRQIEDLNIVEAALAGTRNLEDWGQNKAALDRQLLERRLHMLRVTKNQLVAGQFVTSTMFRPDIEPALLDPANFPHRLDFTLYFSPSNLPRFTQGQLDLHPEVLGQGMIYRGQLVTDLNAATTLPHTFPGRTSSITPPPSRAPQVGASQLSLFEFTHEKLRITGPFKWLYEISSGVSPAMARGLAISAATGTAAATIYRIGNRTSQKVMDEDENVKGWIRVTSLKPCEFCAMLSSKGPVYKTEKTAKGSRFSTVNMDFKVHDNCACVAEPVYEENLPRHKWPGQSGEFRNFWDQTMKNHDFEYEPGMDASREARRVFNREYRQSSYFSRNRLRSRARLLGDAAAEKYTQAVVDGVIDQLVA